MKFMKAIVVLEIELFVPLPEGVTDEEVADFENSEKVKEMKETLASAMSQSLKKGDNYANVKRAETTSIGIVEV
jgi:hypothetical protein